MGRHWKKDFFGPLSPEVTAKKILAFDTETREDPALFEEETKHSGFILGVVYDGERFYEFYTQEEMIEFFRMKKWAGYQCWACNLEYDLNAVFTGYPNEELFRNYFGGILKGATFVQEHRMIPAKGKRGREGQKNESNRLLHFCDTLNHWKAGVAELGRMVGLDKLTMPTGGLPDREMVMYCKRDAEIVYRAVEMFQQEYNDFGCNLQGSIASSAMDLYRRRFMKKEWGFRRIPRQFINFFQAGYFGGRTENFVLGRFGEIKDRTGGPRKPIHGADVNSMYPSVMCEVAVPLLHNPHCSTNAKALDFEGMTRAVVNVPEQKYPPLPYRHVVSKDASKLFFPTGRWEGVFTNLELRYAMEHCGVTVERIIDSIYFIEAVPVFKEYVETIYEERLRAKAAGDQVRQYTMKIFGNSLYGKTAQIGEILTIAPRWMRKEPQFEEYGCYAARRQDGKPAIYTNFVWAAYITSGSRCKLHGHLVRLDALYCDTDSVYSYTKVEPTKELGALNYEDSSPYFEVLGPKTYKTKTKTRMKGIPADAWGAEMVKSPDGNWEFTFKPIHDMERLPKEVFFTEVSRFRGAIRAGALPNSWGIGEKTLRLYPEDRKRFFYADGSSRPLTVEEVQAIRTPWAGVVELPFFKCEGEIRVKRRKQA